MVRRAKSTGFENLPIKPSRSGASRGSSPATKRDNPTKPLINWLAKKLGQGRATRTKALDARVAGSHSKTTDTPRSILAPSAQASSTVPLPRSRQRSAAAAPSVRLSTHRPGSIRTRNSGRSYQPSSIFSPARHRACPRASFITRSSASPTHSPSLSPSSSSQSLASSYLALEDPDSRSYVATLDLPDENASTQPIPPSRPHSPALSAANSAPSSMHFHADLHRGMLHAGSFRSHSLKNRSRSASQVTVSSFGSPGKTVRSTPSIVSTKPTTVFNESETALGLGQPFAQIAVPPRSSHHITPLDDVAGNSGLNWESRVAISRDPSALAEPLVWNSLSAMMPAGQRAPPDNSGEASPNPSQPCSPASSLQRTRPSPDLSRSAIHVPGYTHHYPQRNPQPDSVPRRNASTHTLASSNFAVPGTAQTDEISLRYRSIDLGLTRTRTQTSCVNQDNAPELGSASGQTSSGREGDHEVEGLGSSAYRDATTSSRTFPGGNLGTDLAAVAHASQPELITSKFLEEIKPDQNEANPEYRRILHAVSADRASLIALRGRRDSRESDTSDASRFSWAAASILAHVGDAVQITHAPSRPSSINSNALGRPILKLPLDT